MDVKVSKLTSYISNIFKTDPILMNIGVIGEISNLKYHGSGAVFFTLKDEKASIRCNMWRQYAEHLRYRLEDGMQVKASGRVTVYEKGGTYSLLVEDVEVSGEGALMAAFRAMYGKLSAEGLFSSEHKKPLPRFPRRVCVITSDTGAALRDMLKIIRARNNFVDVLVYPVLVQGEGAAAEISAAIRDVNRRFSDVDVIITGRGGGSLEDLWAFNEEPVARAIFDSEIPVISAVGHETDVTIADFAADARAETPTAAAALAVPDLRDVRAELDQLFRYRIRERLDFLYRRKEADLERCSPRRMINSLKNRYMIRAEGLRRYAPETMSRSVKVRVEKYEAALNLLTGNLKRSADDRIRERSEALERLKIMIDAADPDRLVKRGYAIVTDGAGNTVSDAGTLRPGERIRVRFRDGTAESEVKKITENADGRSYRKKE